MDDEKQIVADAENLLIQQLQLLDVEPLTLAHDFIGIQENKISSDLNNRVPKLLHARCSIKILKDTFCKDNVIILGKDSL